MHNSPIESLRKTRAFVGDRLPGAFGKTKRFEVHIEGFSLIYVDGFSLHNVQAILDDDKRFNREDQNGMTKWQAGVENEGDAYAIGVTLRDRETHFPGKLDIIVNGTDRVQVTKQIDNLLSKLHVHAMSMDGKRRRELRRKLPTAMPSLFGK